MQRVASPFRDRDQLYADAASSLRNQKLQKKLAKDAAVQKQAEDALRRASQQGGHCTVLLTEVPDEDQSDHSRGEERLGGTTDRERDPTAPSRSTIVGVLSSERGFQATVSTNSGFM